ncbi:DEAD/DEAH box helicase [Rhodovibrio sodomensis]|nr:DEAD/DEAH box helicase family protein [Rhodovibrio sodomensis]
MPKQLHFQRRTTLASLAHLRESMSSVVVVPTGGGKTGILASVSETFIDFRKATGARREQPKVLLLTHSRTLFQQMLHGKDGRPAELSKWTDRKLGQVAPEPMGGIQQNADIVVAMVQTAAKHADKLDGYDLIAIDEGHHAYERKANGQTSHYRQVIDAVRKKVPDACVLAATATPFRETGEMDRELVEAPAAVVTYQEVLDTGRIVRPRTVMVDLKGGNGKRTSEIVATNRKANNRTELPGDIGTKVKSSWNEATYDQMVDQWLKQAGSKKTIFFFDQIKEVEQLAKAFERANARYEFAQPLRLGQVHRRNKRADQELAEFQDPNGSLRVVAAVDMVTEGLDVTEVEAVACCRGKPTRATYAQIGGRGMRACDRTAKREMLFLDFGAGAYDLGRLEDQIDTQSESRALEGAGRDDFEARMVLPEVWSTPDKAAGYSVFASTTHTFAAVADPAGGLRLFAAQRQMGSGTKQAARRFERLKAPDSGLAWLPSEVAALTRAEIDDNFGWHAVRRPGLAGGRDEIARTDFDQGRGALDLYVKGDLGQSPRQSPWDGMPAGLESRQGREQFLREAIQEAKRTGSHGRISALSRHIDSLAGTPEECARERAHLTSVALRTLGEAARENQELRQRCIGGASHLSDLAASTDPARLRRGLNDAAAKASAIIRSGCEQLERQSTVSLDNVARSLQALAKPTQVVREKELQR